MIFADLSNITSSFSTILSICALLVALVLGVLNVRNKYSSGRDAQTITSLKNSNEAYETQSKTDNIKMQAKTAELASVYGQNKALVQKAEVLEDLKTQAQPIARLITQNANQHKDIMLALAKLTESNGKLAVELGNIAKAVLKETNHGKR